MTDTLTWLIKQLESDWFPATDSYEWRDPTEALNCWVCAELCLRLTGIGLRYIVITVSNQRTDFSVCVSVYTSVHAAYVYEVKCCICAACCTVLLLKIDPISTSCWLLLAKRMLLLLTYTFWRGRRVRRADNTRDNNVVVSLRVGSKDKFNVAIVVIALSQRVTVKKLNLRHNSRIQEQNIITTILL